MEECGLCRKRVAEDRHYCLRCDEIVAEVQMDLAASLRDVPLVQKRRSSVRSMR